MEALELYKTETVKRKEIEAEENRTGNKVSGRILNSDIPRRVDDTIENKLPRVHEVRLTLNILLQKDSIPLHPMFQAYNVSTPTKFVLEILKKVKSRYNRVRN